LNNPSTPYILNTKGINIPKTIKMRFTIAAAAIVAGASAHEYGYGYPPAVPVNSTSVASYPADTPSSSAYVPVVVTKTVSEYTSYCPGPTTITEGSSTYTVTEATTLTIPCGKCVITTTETPGYPTPTATITASSVEVPSYPSSEVPAPAPYPTAGNGTIPSSYPTGTGAVPAPSNPPTEFPGSASQMGVGMLAVVGAIAAFL
jgi:hypothetical protein